MEDKPEPAPTSESLKELGNKAVKEGKFEEATLHYTHAIKRDPKNHVLYSNRSFVFLRLQQYSLAMEDAVETIRLSPAWAKGYFRKAEIEYGTCNYGDARQSYEMALKFKPDDGSLHDAVEKCKRMMAREAKADEQIPWLGSGIGIVIGVIIVIADYVFTTTPTHPMVMAFITIFIAIAGYFIAKVYRSYVKNQRTALLENIDLFGDDEEPEDAAMNGKTETKTRYTKSQARQRFRKGKM